MASANTATALPTDSMAVTEWLRAMVPEEMAERVSSLYPFLFGMATVKLAVAHTEIARLKAAPERITIACATGDCYETVSYDASDLYGQGIFDCLIDDGWGRTSDGTGRCPKCVALDGPRYDRDELAKAEND